MQSRPPSPDDPPLLRALATVRTAAYVLRDLDFGALDELDGTALHEWTAGLSSARAVLLSMLKLRGCEELELPPRGQLDRFDHARVERHAKGISKNLLAELERVDAAPASLNDIGTAAVLNLIYSVRSIEQLVAWLDPVERLRARVREAARQAQEQEREQAEQPQEPEPEPEQEPQREEEQEREYEPALPAEASFDDVEALLAETSVEQLPPLAPPLPTPPVAALPPPPRRMRRDVELGGFLDDPDENGAAVRVPPVSVHHAATRGPQRAGRALCLGATRAMPIEGGAAFALADGPDSSVGARLASVAATTLFCNALAAAPTPNDARKAILAAAEAAREKLNKLLQSLIESADDSDALGRVRGTLSSTNLRRILEHTASPDSGLRHVTPALTISFAAGALLRTPRETFELTFLSIGASVVERKQRGLPAQTLLPPDPLARFGPGAANPFHAGSIPVWGPVELSPGDLVLIGTSAIRRGYEGPALETLSQLCPDVLLLGSPHEDHALRVLRQASAAADVFEALEERRRTSPAAEGGARLLAGDLCSVLLTFPLRTRTPTIVPPPLR